MKITDKELKDVMKKICRPPAFLDYFIIDPSKVKFTPLARLKCQNCGLYNRVPRCAPNVPSLEESEKKIHSMNKGLILVYQNDGSKPWKKGVKRDGPLQGKKLKGTAAGMARLLNQNIYDIVMNLCYNNESLIKDKNIIGLISGHCQLCGKCPMKDKYDSPGVMKKCKKGFSALEAIGIDCFNLMDLIDVKHEKVPWNFVTLIGGVFV